MCNVLADENHPKRCCSIVLKFLCFAFMLLGLTIFILGIVFAVIIPASSVFAVVLLLTGGAIIVAGFFGILGSGYGVEGKEGRYLCLAIFFLVAMIGAILLYVFALLCMTSQDLLISYVAMFWEKMDSAVDLLEGKSKSYVEQLKASVQNMFAIGAVGLVTAIVVTFGWLVASYIMGFDKFIETLLFLGSLVISIVGIIVMVICIALKVLVDFLADQTMILVAGIVLGVVVLIVGLFGFVGACCAVRKHKYCLITVFFFLIVLITLAFLLIGIICFAVTDSVVDKMDTTLHDSVCKLDAPPANETGALLSTSSCYAVFISVYKLNCDNDLNDSKLMDEDDCKVFTLKNGTELPRDITCRCYNITDARDVQQDGFTFYDVIYFNCKDYLLNFIKANYKILGIIGVVVGIFLVIMVFASFIECCCISKKHKDE